ncbi:hypothetical protein GCM10007877_34890 [Marinibactrum halimedae]|uniref:Uncharacterized protein n=2 Tax=Marinibactrum halimedae TaxID=1444977 RepID=A0AA37WNQ2_9GAMM|nr:hypothetical protein GCM10007877_34890 [Marinibactrum halimedae]
MYKGFQISAIKQVRGPREKWVAMIDGKMYHKLKSDSETKAVETAVNYIKSGHALADIENKELSLVDGLDNMSDRAFNANYNLVMDDLSRLRWMREKLKRAFPPLLPIVDDQEFLEAC